MNKHDLRTNEDEWEDVKYLARFCVNVIVMAEVMLRLAVMLFALMIWLGLWIRLFECCGINPYYGFVVGLLMFVLMVWVGKRIGRRIW
jgi:hypothetical protein